MVVVAGAEGLLHLAVVVVVVVIVVGEAKKNMLHVCIGIYLMSRC